MVFWWKQLFLTFFFVSFHYFVFLPSYFIYASLFLFHYRFLPHLFFLLSVESCIKNELTFWVFPKMNFVPLTYLSSSSYTLCLSFHLPIFLYFHHSVFYLYVFLFLSCKCLTVKNWLAYTSILIMLIKRFKLQALGNIFWQKQLLFYLLSFHL